MRYSMSATAAAQHQLLLQQKAMAAAAASSSSAARQQLYQVVGGGLDSSRIHSVARSSAGGPTPIALVPNMSVSGSSSTGVSVSRTNKSLPSQLPSSLSIQIGKGVSRYHRNYPEEKI